MSDDAILTEKIESDYKYGFTSDIEMDSFAKGLSEDTVRAISQKKEEPEWMLEWRLKAYRHWLTMKEPDWAKVSYPKINYQDIIYYAAPKKFNKLTSLEDLDPEIKKTYDKLGIPLEEQKFLAGVAVDAVLDSAMVLSCIFQKVSAHQWSFQHISG